MFSRARMTDATQRVTIGIDPGQSGAVAVLADGEPVKVFDMPCTARKNAGHEVSAAALAIELRAIVRQYPGAHVSAVVEQVAAMRGWGTGGSFRFGEAFGIVKGVLATAGIGYRLVGPPAWKRHHGLIGAEKDASRGAVMQRWPETAAWLTRKKDDGRADAILIAAWHHDTEQHAQTETAA